VALPAATPTPAPVSVAAGAPNLKCACRHCNGRISFPANAAGSSIACPHCGKETPLIAPGVSASAAAPTPAPAHAPAPAPAAPVRAKAPTPPVPTEEELSEPPARKGGGKKVMIIVGVLLALALVAGGAFIVIKKKGGGGNPLSMLGPKEDLQVVNFELQKNQGTSLVYVTGKLKNNSDVQHTSVRVDFKLLDASGKQIGNASDYIMILDAQQEWEFKALVVEPEVAKAEVEKVTSGK